MALDSPHTQETLREAGDFPRGNMRNRRDRLLEQNVSIIRLMKDDGSDAKFHSLASPLTFRSTIHRRIGQATKTNTFDDLCRSILNGIRFIGRFVSVLGRWWLGVLFRFATAATRLSSLGDFAATATFANRFCRVLASRVSAARRNGSGRLRHHCDDQRKRDGKADNAEVLHKSTR